MTDLCDFSASELCQMIAGGDISPVDIMQSCIARAEATNPALNAIVSSDFDRALDSARKAEVLLGTGKDTGPLYGLPVAVKDLEATAGIRSTMGSLLHADDIPDSDQGSVARIKAAGGIVFGKTNTPEFGTGGNTRNLLFGTTVNPFDTQLTCGGSSGGSAVALASGMVPLATGSDFGGSLRTPAGFCGVVGFRPSPGIVPIEDYTTSLLPFAVLGPMARSVDDAVLLLRAMKGYDSRDLFSSAAHEMLDAPIEAADLGSIKVAFSDDLGQVAMSRGNRALFAARTATFRHHFRTAEDDTPDLRDVHNAFEVLRGVGYVASHGEAVALHRDRLSPNVIDNVERGLGYSLSDVATAHQQQTKLAQNWRAFFEHFDVLICPASSVSPFAHENWSVSDIDGMPMDSYMRWLGITYAPTMALGCAVALPCGVDDHGMPFGIQVLGPRGGDRKVLEVAKALEAVLATNMDTKRPVPDLSYMAAQEPMLGRV